MSARFIKPALASAPALILFQAVSAWAQDPAISELPATDFSTALVKMVAGLALVLGILVGLYWLSRRFLPGSVAGGNVGMRLLGRLGLGSRKYVALVEVAGKVLILGVSNDRINLLSEVEDQSKVSALTQPKGLGFAKILQKAKGEDK